LPSAGRPLSPTPDPARPPAAPPAPAAVASPAAVAAPPAGRAHAALGSADQCGRMPPRRRAPAPAQRRLQPHNRGAEGPTPALTLRSRAKSHPGPQRCHGEAQGRHQGRLPSWVGCVCCRQPWSSNLGTVSGCLRGSTIDVAGRWLRWRGESRGKKECEESNLDPGTMMRCRCRRPPRRRPADRLS
jgi:hypothetical protein